MALSAARGKLLAVIGDEDTCTGFLLGGIGELDKNRRPNYFTVDKETSLSSIEEAFKSFHLFLAMNTCSFPRSNLDVSAAEFVPSEKLQQKDNKQASIRQLKEIIEPVFQGNNSSSEHILQFSDRMGKPFEVPEYRGLLRLDNVLCPPGFTILSQLLPDF
ncbi:V-type H+-transporting ATPase subunit F, partial [Paragonimus westermani]